MSCCNKCDWLNNEHRREGPFKPFELAVDEVIETQIDQYIEDKQRAEQLELP